MTSTPPTETFVASPTVPQTLTTEEAIAELSRAGLDHTASELEQCGPYEDSEEYRLIDGILYQGASRLG